MLSPHGCPMGPGSVPGYALLSVFHIIDDAKRRMVLLEPPPILRFIRRRSWHSPRHEACPSSDISSVKRFVGKPTSQNLRRKNQQVERLQEMKRKQAFIQQGLKFPQPLIDRQSQYRNLQNTCKQDGPGFFELHG